MRLKVGSRAGFVRTRESIYLRRNVKMTRIRTLSLTFSWQIQTKMSPPKLQVAALLGRKLQSVRKKKAKMSEVALKEEPSLLIKDNQGVSMDFKTHTTKSKLKSAVILIVIAIKVSTPHRILQR